MLPQRQWSPMVQRNHNKYNKLAVEFFPFLAFINLQTKQNSKGHQQVTRPVM